MTEARSRSTDRRYYGVAEGIVTDVNDPEREGRVKVRFPWFDDETVSDWCRVRQLYAGGGFGTFFVPEPGDEVLVAFIHGDMRLPIVLGGLYNGEDKPSTHRADDRDEKVVRTRGGHELLFDDRSGHHRAHLTTPGGHKLEMDDENRKAYLKTSGGHEVLLDDGENKVTIKTSGGQSVELDGNTGKVTVKGAEIVLDATASVKLGGPTAAESVLLGTSFLALFNSHTHNCTAPGTPSGPPLPLMTPAQLSMKTTTS